MKLGELFVQLGVQGDTKELKKTLADMKEADKLSTIELQKRKRLAEATTAEDKALIQKNADNKKEIVQLEKTISKKEENNRATMAAVRGFAAFATGAAVVYKVIDRMISSLVQANAHMITFNRTTGISLSSLNKYASAAMAVNPNATIEGTAQSMSNLASNLYDIRMGRGDVSPYQELAFVGGRAFNPMGMTPEQVIENLRESLKGVNDIQATNIITRMGFSPEDLQMLRMSRAEFEKIQSLFLDPSEREAINKYGIEIKKLKLQMNLFKDRALLTLMPVFLKITQVIRDFFKQISSSVMLWSTAIDRLTSFADACSRFRDELKLLAAVFLGLMTVMHPWLAGLTAIYLVVEDIVGYFLGWDSVTGMVVDGFKQLSRELNEIKMPKWIENLANLIPLMLQIGGGALFGSFGQDVGSALSEPVPVGVSNSSASYDNRTSNVTQNNEFRISAAGNGLFREITDNLMTVSYNAIIAQNIGVA